MSDAAKLGDFLAEVSNWDWADFWRAERDESYSSNQAVILNLIRACAMQKMDAIKLAINRLDGKLKTPVKVEYPKIYILYPNATLPITDEKGQNEHNKYSGISKSDSQDIVLRDRAEPAGAVVQTTGHDEAEVESDLPSLTIRQTLSKMSNYPRALPPAILELALQTEQWLRGQAEQPDEIPKVKSVIAAHLLDMANRRNIAAIEEVFDSIDGKLVETIKILGEDIFITSYLAPPPEAYLNADGVVQAEAPQMQDMWTNKLGG